MSKRRKVGVTNFRTARPIDKQLKAIKQTVAATQLSSLLLTVTFPCTITGLRWELSVRNDHAAVDSIFWALVIVRDGNIASAIGVSDAADFYAPETDVLAFGNIQLAPNNATTGDSTHTWNGSTKTMRKMMGGDTLQLLVDGSAAASKEFGGVVQFFCKS